MSREKTVGKKTTLKTFEFPQVCWWWVDEEKFCFGGWWKKKVKVTFFVLSTGFMVLFEKGERRVMTVMDSWRMLFLWTGFLCVPLFWREDGDVPRGSVFWFSFPSEGSR